jgi:membrane protease YdiL (CAAX protease family)
MSEENGEPPPIAYPVTPTDALQAGVPPVAVPVGPTMPRRGSALAGWIVVLAIVGGIIYMQNARPLTAKGPANGEGAAVPTETSVDPSLVALFELQSRIAVGSYQAMLAAEADEKDDETKKSLANAREQLAAQASKLNQGIVAQRLRAIITVGELGGPAKAAQAFEELADLLKNHPAANTPNVAHAVDVFTRLYRDYADGRPDAPTVDRDERALIARFGWFGDLALGNPQSNDDDSKVRRQRALDAAARTWNTVYVAGFVVAGAFVVGVVTLIALAIVWTMRRNTAHPMKSGLGPPVPHHAVYVETFAAWLTLYIAASAAMRYLVPGGLLPPMVFLCVSISLPVLAALLSLFWPVLRGIPWKQVRHDIGLTGGRQPLLEPTIGVLVFGTELPFVIVGAMCSILLILGQVLATGIPAAGMPGLPGIGQAELPAGADPFASGISVVHPVVGVLAYGSATEAILLLILGCIFAPVCEELLFRGVLYRHLRDATRRFGIGGFLFSAFAVNLTFAAIHPQGLFAVPALMAVAFAFTLAREWRGTLIPAMVAHSINNSLIFGAVFQALR